MRVHEQYKARVEIVVLVVDVPGGGVRSQRSCQAREARATVVPSWGRRVYLSSAIGDKKPKRQIDLKALAIVVRSLHRSSTPSADMSPTVNISSSAEFSRILSSSTIVVADCTPLTCTVLVLLWLIPRQSMQTGVGLARLLLLRTSRSLRNTPNQIRSPSRRSTLTSNRASLGNMA